MLRSKRDKDFRIESPPASRVRSHGRRPGAAACAELHATAAHRRAVADRIQLADGTGEVGDSRVPAHRRTAEPHNRVVGRNLGEGRSRVAVARNRAAVDHTRAVGRNRAAAHKHTVAACNWAAVADHIRAVARSRVATHSHTATAHNQVAAQSHPGLWHPELMRRSREALRMWQWQCKDGA
jgi:hypothetical protein